MAQWAQDQRHYAPNTNTPEAVINGFGVLGGNSLANLSYTSNINRVNDDFAITRGGAMVHFGGGFAYNPATQQHEANLNGRFDFDSLTDFLDNSPRRYQQTFIVGDAVVQRLGAATGALRQCQATADQEADVDCRSALGRAVESAAHTS